MIEIIGLLFAQLLAPFAMVVALLNVILTFLLITLAIVTIMFVGSTIFEIYEKYQCKKAKAAEKNDLDIDYYHDKRVTSNFTQTRQEQDVASYTFPVVTTSFPSNTSSETIAAMTTNNSLKS